jgi:hypothetical protein
VGLHRALAPPRPEHLLPRRTKTFINRDPAKLDDAEQLTLTLEQSLDDTRRHELAIELAERVGIRRPGPSDADLDMDLGM